jgi:hypothetical protein
MKETTPVQVSVAPLLPHRTGAARNGDTKAVLASDLHASRVISSLRPIRAHIRMGLVSLDPGNPALGTPHQDTAGSGPMPRRSRLRAVVLPPVRDTYDVPEYRIFHLTFGHIRGPAAIINCGVDQQAIEKAKQMVNGHDIEVWQGVRRVIEIKKPVRK